MNASIPSTYFNRLVMIYQNRFRKFPFPYIDDPLKDFPNSPFCRFSSSHTPLFILFQKGCTGIPTCITKESFSPLYPHPPQPTERLQQYLCV
ncbi:hypothetical protein CEXT_766651 [Caerostris extrusa]|uniref:Uncharacterized protein n=1 Tax=Caerostris extrusa TaxID=172846 RepID=A0AAV4WH50_CAEEX|nr:hypothetical protein CEXT_766651 [Caerostris extrusa]